MRIRPLLIRAAALFLMVALFIELPSFLFFQLGETYPVFRARIFYPADLSDAEIQRYIVQRDDLLGWPVDRELARDHDDLGARRSPANEALGGEPYCFEFYGDSYTFAHEVGPRAAWPNRLAAKSNCRVLNFGVNGYGVDQAVLRHETMDKYADHAGLVIYPDNIKRNLNQQRSLITSAFNSLEYKPRFVMAEQNTLELIKPFSGTVEEYRHAIRFPWEVLDHERFLPGSDNLYSKIVPDFPYTWSIVQLAKKLITETDFERLMSLELERPYSWHHPTYFFHSMELKVEARIVLELMSRRFLANCADKSQECFIILMPAVDQLLAEPEAEGAIDFYFQNIREWPEFVDLTDYLQAQMGQDLCRFIGQGDCAGHFNQEGYEVVAEFFHRKFAEALGEQFLGHKTGSATDRGS